MLSKQPFFDLLRQGSGTLLRRTMPQLLGVRIARKRSRNQPFDVVKLADHFQQLVASEWKFSAMSSAFRFTCAQQLTSRNGPAPAQVVVHHVTVRDNRPLIVAQDPMAILF